MRTKSLVAAVAVSILSLCPIAAKAQSTLDTTIFLLINQYGSAMVNAENCDLPERFVYESIVMTAVANSPGIDFYEFRKAMNQNLEAERDRSGTKCYLEAQAGYESFIRRLADDLVEQTNK